MNFFQSLEVDLICIFQLKLLDIIDFGSQNIFRRKYLHYFTETRLVKERTIKIGFLHWSSSTIVQNNSVNVLMFRAVWEAKREIS